MASGRRTFSRVSPSKSALFICDVQERFKPHIVRFDEMVQVCKRLIDVAALLDMKMIATEQYPKGLGRTVPELEIEKHNIPVFDKQKFSMCIPPVIEEFGDQYESVILCGIECHVCILHTTLDMLERGVQVYVVVDAVSSRTKTDRLFGLKQLEQAGAILTTSECVILGLVGGSDHPKFKEVQKIIKTPAPDTELLPDFPHC